MITDELRQLLTDSLTCSQPLDLLRVTQEGDASIKIVAVSSLFCGMSRVQRQRMVYQPLLDHFSEKRIHALTINTFTPQEWQRQLQLT